MKSAKVARDGMRLARSMSRAKYWPEERHGDGIVENGGLVDELVRGAANGDAKSCLAGAASLHDSSVNGGGFGRRALAGADRTMIAA